MILPRRKWLGVLLVATVLAWGAMPPAIRHAHEGGDDAGHRHGRHAVCHDHHAPHDHEGGAAHHHYRGHEHRDAGPACEWLSPEVAHLHLHWLGFELTLPDRNPGPHRGDEREGGWELAFVRATEESTPGGQGQLSGVGATLPAKAGISEGEIAFPAEARGLRLVFGIPLCDRARHERSGVRLA